MRGERVERRLAAILVADVAGYSRLMSGDEAGTLARLRTHRRELIDPRVAEHKGRIVKTTGDGLLIEFPSVVEAVACAVAVQQGMAERNAAMLEHQRIVFRVGINVGDVIVEDGDIHGDGVNVAARLEALAEPGSICVSAVVQDQVRGRLDCAFDDLGEQALKNIARPVRVYRVALTRHDAEAPRSTLSRTAGEGGRGQSPMAGEGGASALPLPDKPSIAVLPFQNMSGDPEQAYFADGMVEEIITALSRIRWLFVIARNSTFTYKGQAIDVRRVGRELGVRYVLEGSVRKGGNRVRITGQLIDTATGTHIWADRFDGSLEDVFDLQDQVAASVAGVIEPALLAAEIERAARHLPSDLTAYDLYLRAFSLMLSFSSCAVAAALELLKQAIERDKDYGPALAAAAICCMHKYLNSWGQSPENDRRAGIAYGHRALGVAGDDPGTLSNAAYALAYFGEDIGTMIGFVERALTHNPSFARGWYLSGWMRAWAGNPDSAIKPLETSLRLSPRARVGDQYLALGAAYFMMERFNEALPRFLIAVQESPTQAAVYRWLAACYAHLGRTNEARDVIEELRAITSSIIPVLPQWRNREHRELFLSGLRLAMGETA